MQPITNLLIDSTRKAIKFLQRDFLELEMLQTSNSGNTVFCNKAYFKLKTLLQDELGRYAKYLFFPEDIFDINNVDAETVFLINPTDSMDNLTRSLPFFALSITCLKKIQGVLTPVTTVLYFPALNEIYYAEKGRGAQVEKNNSSSANHQNSRLRTSGNRNLKNALVVTDSLNNIASEIEIKNIRVFGSNCYAAILLATGKIDVIYLSSLDYITSYALELLIKESGGIIISSAGKFIATNYYLSQKIKDLHL